MSVRKFLVESNRREIDETVDRMLEAKAREVRASIEIAGEVCRLTRAVDELSNLALDSLDPDPDELTEEETQDFVRRSTLAY